MLGGAEMRAFELIGRCPHSPACACGRRMNPRPQLVVLHASDQPDTSETIARFCDAAFSCSSASTFTLGRWLYLSRPSRTARSSTLSPEFFAERLRQVSVGGRRPVEPAFASDALRRITGLAGVVQDSIIDTGYLLSRGAFETVRGSVRRRPRKPRRGLQVRRGRPRAAMRGWSRPDARSGIAGGLRSASGWARLPA